MKLFRQMTSRSYGASDSQSRAPIISMSSTEKDRYKDVLMDAEMEISPRLEHASTWDPSAQAPKKASLNRSLSQVPVAKTSSQSRVGQLSSAEKKQYDDILSQADASPSSPSVPPGMSRSQSASSVRRNLLKDAEDLQEADMRSKPPPSALSQLSGDEKARYMALLIEAETAAGVGGRRASATASSDETASKSNPFRRSVSWGQTSPTPAGDLEPGSTASAGLKPPPRGPPDPQVFHGLGMPSTGFSTAMRPKDRPAIHQALHKGERQGGYTKRWFFAQACSNLLNPPEDADAREKLMNQCRGMLEKLRDESVRIRKQLRVARKEHQDWQAFMERDMVADKTQLALATADLRKAEGLEAAAGTVMAPQYNSKVSGDPEEVQRRIVVMTALLNDALNKDNNVVDHFNTADFLAQMRRFDRSIASRHADGISFEKEKEALRHEIDEMQKIEAQLARRCRLDLQEESLNSKLPDRSRDTSRSPGGSGEGQDFSAREERELEAVQAEQEKELEDLALMHEKQLREEELKGANHVALEREADREADEIEIKVLQQRLDHLKISNDAQEEENELTKDDLDRLEFQAIEQAEVDGGGGVEHLQRSCLQLRTAKQQAHLKTKTVQKVLTEAPFFYRPRGQYTMQRREDHNILEVKLEKAVAQLKETKLEGKRKVADAERELKRVQRELDMDVQMLAEERRKAPSMESINTSKREKSLFANKMSEMSNDERAEAQDRP